MNIPHDFSCHEGSKNVYFIQVRNLEGQNHPGHTVNKDVSNGLEKWRQIIGIEFSSNLVSFVQQSQNYISNHQK